jgi:anti-anti-sigma factor
MDFQVKDEELRLAGQISINDVESLVKVLTEYIQAQKEIVKINLADVETMDIIILQMLVAAKKTTKQADKRFELFNVKSDLRETFELAGMDSVFKLSFAQSSA